MELFWQSLPWLCAGLALLSLVFALRSGRHQLLIDNLPTSKTSGVFMGLVELKGTAETDAPVKSQFMNVECVWFRYTVRERSTTYTNTTSTDSDGRTTSSRESHTEWTTIASVTQDSLPFFLKDDRGVVRVQPKGAKIEPQTALNKTFRRGDDMYDQVFHREVANSDGVREIKEEVIRLHTRIFVVGQARQRRDIVAAEIAADPQAPLFLISTKSEESVSRGLWWKFWGLGLLGLALALFALYLREYIPNGRAPAIMSLVRVGVIYCALWFAGWLVMMCNSLIELRQRVRSAWANIDVELKRRADLLPNLAKMVTGLLEHEKKVQPLIAGLRAQAGATAPGRGGPDPAALSAPLRLIAEAYPALKSQALFLKLQKQLAETEDRIALARNYFNDIATFYNTRLGIFPDGMLAGLMGMRVQPLMNEAGFVRAPMLMKTPGSDTAGPCPKCQADVRSREGIKFCPFCGSDQLVPAANGMPGSCRGCGGYQKPVSAGDNRLLGNVLYCGKCRFKLVK